MLIKMIKPRYKPGSDMEIPTQGKIVCNPFKVHRAVGNNILIPINSQPWNMHPGKNLRARSRKSW